ncbi:MAG: hypothetical protein EOQ42_34790 [Mesorhizobium sp.]|uniref:hypothetical protein n=1 Tax=unclassified Mesorhizobium TaxID=325217 RepID=UPI000FE58E37|nr:MULTISPECIES: hypothetical protein [unclassified Mesorhizobium]RWB26181.1 MAG: hypothetical protein EOQ41_21400 [Mesorhizobium sp.]RWB26274.1 MAG: hypothetical protein EOQ42_34790 [Mesorhizobium sp.]RWB29414.1 MAG: hypothetical protein EOQ43_19685 [Mesorhizobium sp.]RWC20788.1 MAG: hypothetical protein EOS51_12925 [Mesorhizobium sp.]RWC99980.1 MAG: hypothetical protein EOS57_27755 [Mesorhizobium sp.]
MHFSSQNWCPAAPIYPESPIAQGISPDCHSVPDGDFRVGWNAKPSVETDVPERKNQNTYLVKYLFHSACGRQGDSESGWRIFNAAEGRQIFCKNPSG